jgi:hypothetical protein
LYFLTPPTEKIEEKVQQLQSVENWLLANPLTPNKPNNEEQQQGQQQKVQIHNASLLSNSVPLKLWPNFKNASKNVSKATVAQTETQTSDLLHQKEQADLMCVSTSCNSASLLTATNSNQQFSETASETDAHINKILGEKFNQAESQDQGHGEEIEEIETQASQAAALEEIAEKVERGIFTAGEACNVLINTVFKDSLGNPSSLERVLECDNFKEFLHSPNEVHALERSAVLLTNCCELIHEYLAAIKRSGVEFPSNKNFAKTSSLVVSVTTSKKNVTLASQQAKYVN